MAPVDKVGVLGASSAAWRKVIANPLKRRKRASELHDPDENGELSSESINAIIEGEILPRLLMAHSTTGSGPDREDETEIHPSDARRFASLPLTHEATSLLEEVDGFLEKGVSVDAICLD
ncbi:MAG: cobalamin B12-binding protein, partial [Pseudomonadota bacterium]